MILRKLIKKFSMPFQDTKISTDNRYESMTEEEFQSYMAETANPTTITVEVVYITKKQQVILEVQVPFEANIEDGIVLSGLLEQCADVDLSKNKVGLYGIIKPLTETLNDGDRIEIYRAVTAKE